MKVIIPLAGKGTRLLPLTRHVPKPLIRVAGRPVMDYVMDMLDGLDMEELVLITGHLKDQVEQHVRTRYRIPARFVEQQVQDGTAGAVALAEPYVDGPVLIIFVDTLFDADLTLVNRDDADGIIWAKHVEDYQRFGVVVTDAHGVERVSYAGTGEAQEVAVGVGSNLKMTLPGDEIFADRARTGSHPRSFS